MTITLSQQLDVLWESSDSPPDVFGFLQQHNGAAVHDVLSVLLKDQRYRWKTDAPHRVEEYLDRLPDFVDDREMKLQLAVGEFQARQAADTIPDIDEFTTRFSDISDQLRSKLSELISRQNAHNTRCTQTQTFVLGQNIGDQQLGRYLLERILGEGAFGQVYLAYDEELQRQVAIKVPTAQRFQQPEDAEKYLAEARTVASLNHPNIVPVYDTGRTDDGSIYVVSKFIDGETLDDRIKHNRPSHEDSAQLIATVAQALHHAHNKRLIHRDVKPGNILLEGPNATPYVADFGLAIREEDYLKERKLAGTPGYMSPEQARGEGHRLDGRSDIFSLGVVLYEMLTGKKPFRGSTVNELLHNVVSVDPRPPRQREKSIPAELERICLKALSKRASDRYATAIALADDLLHWSKSPQQEKHEHQIVPKGLRSFDAEDTDFFLDLLPGPRTRSGMPESIQFWKRRIEEVDPDKTFSVGLIYGPSGCGKSSLVKAGLLPLLSTDVTAIYVEATPDETETRILRGIQKSLPTLPRDLGLTEAFSLLRRADGHNKVVVILDQFEQWLHTHQAEQENELVAAFRQCDGGRLQTVVMVRDDFGMAAARFMDALDIPVLQGHNYATVDLFDVGHAEKVLIKFGQAFGKLPAQIDNLSDDERAFVHSVVSGLAQDGKVVSVRLALFAEMVKGKPWIPSSLDEVGGTEGVGINFLEETFSSRTANPKHRLHERATRELLKALLPEVGSDIKGHMRSHSDLLEASGYENTGSDFNELLRILDGQLRLITPTDPEGFQSESGSYPGAKFYQLTHDYLVQSLRDWLTRKQQETLKGRAEIKLAERAALWNAKPENRHLPSLFEWGSIRTLTAKKRWTDPQRKMMHKARQLHSLRSLLILAGLLVVVFAGVAIRNAVEQQRQELLAEQRKEQQKVRAAELVKGLLQADTSNVSNIIQKDLINFRQDAENQLKAAFAQSPNSSNTKLHAALGMLPDDKSVLPFLKDRLLTVTPTQFEPVLNLLKDDKNALVASYWETANTGETTELRFQAACALASLDPTNKTWQDEDFQTFIAGHLVSVSPSDLLPWRNALHPVKERLTSALSLIYRTPEAGQQARSFATDTLADYWADNPEGLFELLAAASEEQFNQVFKKLTPHREKAIELGLAEIAKTVAANAGEEDKELLARRQANTAVMLLQTDAADQVWPLLKHTPDPRVRSYIIHWLSPRGLNPAAVLSRYEQETDVTIKRALLLCLGEFDMKDTDKQPLIEHLLSVYRSDPDAGLHAAAEWLLLRWQQKAQLAAIDNELQETEDDLIAGKDKQRQWYVNTQGQTYAILNAGDFEMNTGAISMDQRSHRRRIARRIAIATKEVTREQWRRFQNATKVRWRADQDQFEPYIRSDDSPMLGMTWYEATYYCNWLSEQEGIPKEQWCYETSRGNSYGSGMKAKDNFLQLKGYRLPTEAEWEYACRAGANSSRYYGAHEALLPRYAWFQTNGENHTHPVATLKPNDFGLFDMYGNAYEWCYDVYASYPTPDEGESAEDQPLARTVDNTDRRVLRGGSYSTAPRFVRSSDRLAILPQLRDVNSGFRAVRTYH